jgi:seryl-tRNA synthetase
MIEPTEPTTETIERMRDKITAAAYRELFEKMQQAQKQAKTAEKQAERLAAALGDILGAIKKAGTMKAPAGHYDEDVYYNGIDFAPQLDIAAEMLESYKLSK